MPNRNIAAENSLSQQRVLQLLHYDPASGVFTWRLTRGGRRAGDEAGCNSSSDHHRVIRVDGRLFLAHRLAFRYMTGEWPEDDVDHRDLNKLNNVWDNLRPATNAENHQNMPMRPDNRSGFVGVSWYSRDQRWKATIKAKGKRHHLGCFDDPVEASAAYVEAKARLHTFQPTVPVPA